MVCDVMTAIVEGEIGSHKKGLGLDQNTGLGSTFNALKIFICSLISTCEVA